MGYPHHIQSPMHGGSSIDPKFPPNTDDYHTHHHHHNHLHHNGYGHNANSMANNMAPLQSNNDYSNGMHHQNVSNGMHPNTTSNYNYPPTISGHFYQQSYNSQMHHVPAPPPPPANNSYSPSNVNGYYGSYYGTNNNSHQMMDLPLQCPNTEPTNTVLGLQELGEFLRIVQKWKMKYAWFCSIQYICISSGLVFIYKYFVIAIY